MTIGIGITHRNRFDLLQFTISKFLKHTNLSQCDITVVDDNSDEEQYVKFIKSNKTGIRIIRNSERLGIAKSKNKLLQQFSDRKYIGAILFDDDCCPIKNGWENTFLQAWEKHQQHHLIYSSVNTASVLKQLEYCTIWNGCLGVCIWLSSYAIGKTGGWDNRFKFYGLEHVELTNRCFELGLSPCGRYVSPKFIESYIHSFDVFGTYKNDDCEFVWQGKSCMSSEEKEECIKENREIVNKLHMNI